MNPRRRRILIPGLLIALLVVAAIASFTGRAEGAEQQPVSRMSDPRITESSGLAISRAHDDLAYTINDSGHDPLVYAVRISTGETVGVTRLDADVTDPEALALHDGTLWIADTGDNTAVRDEIALLALPEPGPGDRTVAPDRYRIALDSPADIEALLIDREGVPHLVTKVIGSGVVYRLDGLSTASPAAPTRLDIAAPPLVTDAAFAPDGSSIVLLTYLGVHVLDAGSWQTRTTLPLPPLAQAETIAYTDPFHVLVGSEGEDSPLYRVGLPVVAPRELAAVPGLGLLVLLVARLGDQAR
ncbi:hypothetical protein BHE97_15685 [Aeromicrobium sp. PE09-221]|uniref:hypothetical protein n=1 Tax=Aeromicrobium sp. PE09-221 TaxID=1898043 RepID=UPI000B3E9DDF|nr:hypothetical protein [Aeromicrobium sp. PE09-221]OUZ07817.1 hypothetical protein BHE97_15685 [Aeromicrobium sp. PE09-221]